MTFPVPQFPLTCRASPGDWPHLSPRREGGGRGGQLGGLPELSPTPAWPTRGEGTPLSPTVTWMQGQVQKQRCGDLSFVHNPDESDSCKAEGRERGEKGEEKGEREEGREESRHRQC